MPSLHHRAAAIATRYERNHEAPASVSDLGLLREPPVGTWRRATGIRTFLSGGRGPILEDFGTYPELSTSGSADLSASFFAKSKKEELTVHSRR